MFEYVSGANFFGEIVEWSGFAIAGLACDNWLPSFCFAFCTAMNIGPRAIQHHNWYLKKFDKYPRSRKALIPFIW
jgi:3-oxo-5-alpha-steroid 4-dehydrogenase 1